MQNDFLTGGSLPVPGGDKIISKLNQYINLFYQHDLPVFASRDWHPTDHCSFHAQGGSWPPHCIAGSNGAAFHAQLELPVKAYVISKATTPEKEAYSAFDETPLNTLLQSQHVQRLFIGGVATEYCVLNTVRDALHWRYRIFVLEDAISAINREPDDGLQALTDMKHLGAQLINYEDLSQ